MCSAYVGIWVSSSSSLSYDALLQIYRNSIDSIKYFDYINMHFSKITLNFNRFVIFFLDNSRLPSLSFSDTILAYLAGEEDNKKVTTFNKRKHTHTIVNSVMMSLFSVLQKMEHKILPFL